MKLLLLLPPIFFFTSIIYRFMDNSVNLFNQYSLPIKKEYVWAIPIKALKVQIEESEDLILIQKLKRCIFIR